MLRKLLRKIRPPHKPLPGQVPQGDIMSVRDRFRALANLPRFLAMVWQISPGMMLASMLLRLAAGAIPLAMLYVGKLIIDEVILQAGLWPDVALNQIWTYLGIELGLAVASDGINRLTALLDGLLGDQFANATSVRMMQHAGTLDLTQFEDSDFYDKMARARRQTLGRTVLLSQLLSQVQDLISMLFLAGGLVAYNPWLILLLAVAVIPAFLGESHFNERSYSLVHGLTPERRELDYLRYTGASDETAKEIKMFGLAHFLSERFKALSDRYFEANRAVAVRRAAWGAVFAGIGSVGYYGAYVMIVLETVAGALTIGDLTFLAGSFNRMRTLLDSFLNRFSRVAEQALYLKDFFDFFDIEPQIKRPDAPLPFPDKIVDGFRFENVGFRYHNSQVWAVRNVSFHLRAGEKLALVGENGAGKTTLVKLLARLYDPDEGRILLEGHDLRDYDPGELRREIGVIFQDFVRFQMTAGLNIAVGRIDEREDDPRIQRAAAMSLADEVVENLPDKYEQMIGRRFANGVDLSGGQWQKIALGRAYMRDASVLILDEPTAALDARAEHDVFVRFSQLTRDKTAVLISHRFSTVRMADRILVLDRGRVLEVGSHEELLKLGGRYSELFELQARGYR